MAASLSGRLRRLESAVGGDVPAALGVPFHPAGVEVGTPDADRLAAEHRERTRCAAVAVLPASDVTL